MHINPELINYLPVPDLDLMMMHVITTSPEVPDDVVFASQCVLSGIVVAATWDRPSCTWRNVCVSVPGAGEAELPIEPLIGKGMHDGAEMLVDGLSMFTLLGIGIDPLDQ